MKIKPSALCIAPWPKGTLGGAPIFVNWSNEKLTKLGYNLDELTPTPCKILNNKYIWALGGEILRTLEISLRSKIRKNIADFYITHAPCGHCPGPGLTMYHGNMLHYTKSRYTKVNPNYWRLMFSTVQLDKLSHSSGRLNIAMGSKHNASWLRKLGIPVFTHLHYPINTDFFSPSKDSKEELRNKLKLPNDKPIAISVGRNDGRKNYKLILRLASEFPNVYFLFIGLSDLHTNKKLNNVTIISHIDRNLLPDFYRASDLFISASFSETGPITLMEAMSCQCAFLSTQTGLADDLYHSDDIFKHAVSSLSWLDFYSKFKLLVESRELRDEISLASRTFAINNFNETLIERFFYEIVANIKK